MGADAGQPHSSKAVSLPADPASHVLPLPPPWLPLSPALPVVPSTKLSVLARRQRNGGKSGFGRHKNPNLNLNVST